MNLETRKDLRGINVEKDWRLILTENQIAECVQICADEINEKFQDSNVVMVCILKGAAWFFTDLTRKLIIPYSTYFIEASSYKNGVTQSESIELLSVINPAKFNNKKVILVDELYDNGNTLEAVKKEIINRTTVKYEDIVTCAAFKKKKPESFKYPGSLDVFGTVVPNVWLVGYGLDDRQEKRGWVNLYAVPKPEGAELTEDDVEIFK